MTDVRLTALNPEDSKVYPVACNASGELLTTKSGDINLDVPGNLTVDGSATFSGLVSSASAIASTRYGESVELAGAPSGALTVGGSGADNKVLIGYDGAAKFAGNVTSGADVFKGPGTNLNASGNIYIQSEENDSSSALQVVNSSDLSNPKAQILHDGSATFVGDVVIGSRGAKWLIRESNGVAMLVEQTIRGAKEPRIEVEEVRDLPRELDLVEGALSEIMGKLKMTLPAGWPVWDGDE